MRPRAAVAWSSGKDSAMMLHRLREAGEVEVAALLTTVSEGAGRVAMHGTPRALLEAQAQAAGLPLLAVAIPDPCPNDAYDAAMAAAVAQLRRKGVTLMAFGDLFLADIRAYRESRLAGTGITPVFPLWGE
jgi:diphthamide synthase (EF-2-diphthine--ammonia ligase)